MNSRYFDFVFLLYLQKYGFRTLTVSLDLHIHALRLVCGGGAMGIWGVDTWTKIGWWDEWLHRTELGSVLGHIIITLYNHLPSPP